MTKKEEAVEEVKVEAKKPENTISTVHTTKYVARFNGLVYEIRAPMVPLSEIVKFCDYFKFAAEATIKEAEKPSEERTEKDGKD